MSENFKVQTIELSSGVLNKDSRYIFLLAPQYYTLREHLTAELERVLEHDKFTIIPVQAESLKLYEVKQ